MTDKRGHDSIQKIPTVLIAKVDDIIAKTQADILKVSHNMEV